MAMQDITLTPRTPLPDANADAEFQTSLVGHMPFLAGFAMSLSRQASLAEDLTQEVLAKAWHSRHAFFPGSNLKAWLCTILRNEYYSQSRRRWRQVAWDEKLAESIPASANQQEWALELSDVLCAMEALPDAQRKALLLVGAGGFSYEETAKYTRAHIGTVKSRVARARETLKAIPDTQNQQTVKPRVAKRKAMNEIIAQLGQLAQVAPAIAEGCWRPGVRR